MIVLYAVLVLLVFWQAVQTWLHISDRARLNQVIESQARIEALLRAGFHQP